MLPYNRRDYESIFEWLKTKAQELSDNRWTDFSEGDIGTVMLHLMSYLADMNNFEIDSTAAELFIDTAVERTSLMEIVKLIGYEPRHYMSAYTDVTVSNPAVGDGVRVPIGAAFSNDDGSITYTVLEEDVFNEGVCVVRAYQGEMVTKTYSKESINKLGRINLPDYEIGVNTVIMSMSTLNTSDTLKRVDDVRFISGEMGFSVHVDLDGVVYIQLPSYWQDIIDSSTIIKVSYLISAGSAGRIGSGVLTKLANVTTMQSGYAIENKGASIGGYDPETVDEIKLNAPIAARTMFTIVTKRDFEEVSTFVEEISQVKALDYLDPESGYKQPDDYYKVQLYAVPQNTEEQSIYLEDGSLTQTGEVFSEYIDERRLASLFVEYKDPVYINPVIHLELFMDENDLRTSLVTGEVITFLKKRFNRDRVKIGESLYGSVIGKEILNNFDYITYCEVSAPDFNIIAGPLEFIDMSHAKFTVEVNNVPTTIETIDESKYLKQEVRVGESILIPKDKGSITLFYIAPEDYNDKKDTIPEGCIVKYVEKVMIVYSPIEWMMGE